MRGAKEYDNLFVHALPWRERSILLLLGIAKGFAVALMISAFPIAQNYARN